MDNIRLNKKNYNTTDLNPEKTLKDMFFIEINLLII